MKTAQLASLELNKGSLRALALKIFPPIYLPRKNSKINFCQKGKQNRLVFEIGHIEDECYITYIYITLHFILFFVFK